MFGKLKYYRAAFSISVTVALITMACDARGEVTVVDVFQNAGIQFGGDTNWNRHPDVTILDNGRVIEKTITLPELGPFSRLLAKLQVNAASDPWDRAGSIYVSTTGGDIELHKFITSFGGTTRHSQDISNLIPLFKRGAVKVKAFIDTWVQTARTIDFSLTVVDEGPNHVPLWTRALFNDQDFRAGKYADNKVSVNVRTPINSGKTILSYLPSGHASDGSGGDEFTQRTHRIFVDNVEVWQGIPWRTDGRNFRSVNPTSGRWGDVWSSDLDRAGWIPGDDVDPILIDLTEHLPASTPHTISFQIDGIRPGDANGYGYWRSSSYLTTFPQDAGPADFNYDGVVDGKDFLIWQRGFGLTNQLNNGAGDADGNRVVDASDLAVWRSVFAAGGSLSTSSAVPEPGSLGLAVAALLLKYLSQCRRALSRLN